MAELNDIDMRGIAARFEVLESELNGITVRLQEAQEHNTETGHMRDVGAAVKYRQELNDWREEHSDEYHALRDLLSAKRALMV